MRREETVWSEPYLDASGLGVVTTAARAIYEKENGGLVGVVAADVPLGDLAGEFGSQSLEEVKAHLQTLQFCSNTSVSECTLQVVRGPAGECTAEELHPNASLPSAADLTAAQAAANSPAGYVDPDAVTLYKSCKALKAAEPNTTSGVYRIQSSLINHNVPIQVFCDMDTDSTLHGGAGYTIFQVESGGISTTRATMPNSCSAIGLQPVVWRTQAHIASLVTRYSSYMQTTTCGGVIGTKRGQSFVVADPSNSMNSDSSSDVTEDWAALDGGDWFISDWRAGLTQPDGNYEPCDPMSSPYSAAEADFWPFGVCSGCWLQCSSISSSGVVGNFDDSHCGVSTGPRYLCSTNDKGGSGIFNDHAPDFVATFDNCKLIEGDSDTKTCLPARPLVQSDVLCEPLNPATMKIKAQPRIDGSNFHELLCCDTENKTSGFTNQCPVTETSTEIAVRWCVGFGRDGTETGRACHLPVWANVLLVLGAVVAGSGTCVYLLAVAYPRCRDRKRRQERKPREEEQTKREAEQAQEVNAVAQADALESKMEEVMPEASA